MKTIIASSSDFAQYDQMRKYWEALGHFISIFAAVESTMHVALWHYAKVPVGTARAVFSGVKTDGAMSLINRLSLVNKPSQEILDDLAYVFAQLGAINKVRNDIVHYGITPSVGDESVVTNAILALDETKLRTTPISPTILGKMTHDLHKIQTHLIVRHIGRAELPQNSNAWFQKPLSASWQYTPPPPPQNQSRNQKGSQKQKRPH